jgi:hypothetical protein
MLTEITGFNNTQNPKRLVNLIIMQMINLDLNKSIRKKRLIYRLSPFVIIDLILDNSIWLILLLAFVLALINKDNYSNTNSIIIAIIFLILILWLLCGLWFKNKLVKISGYDNESNRKLIIQLFNDKFPDLKMDESDKQFIIFDKRVGLFNWGKIITVIFVKETIYINWTTLGRHNFRSPFHAPFNHYKLNQIKKDFKYNGN